MSVCVHAHAHACTHSVYVVVVVVCPGDRTQLGGYSISWRLHLMLGFALILRGTSGRGTSLILALLEFVY